MARVEQSIEVNVPIRIAYMQLAKFEEFPRFMKGVHSVHQLDDTHLHWYAEKGGKDMEWDAEITEHIPEQSISWRNTNGPKNEGRVVFEALGPDKTRILLQMEADEIMLKHADATSSSIPQEDEDLARFKKMIESQVHQGQMHAGIDQYASTAAPTSFGGHHKPYPDTSEESAKNHEEASRNNQLGGEPLQRAADAAADAPGTRRTADPDAQNTGQRDAGSEERFSFTDKFSEDTGASRSTFKFPSGLASAFEEPFAKMRKLSEEMNQFLGRWERTKAATAHAPAATSAHTEQSWVPAIDMEQQGNVIVIQVDLPGVKKENVKIEVSRDTLTIEGERLPWVAQSQGQSHHAERPHGYFSRSIPVPEGVEPDTAQASLRDGVLEIRLQMASSPRTAKRIEIQSDER